MTPRPDASRPATPNRRSEITRGISLSAAAGLGMFPLGIAFGLLCVQIGLPWWVAPLTTVVVYAGSSEMMLVTLMTAGAPLGTIALTTFFVNFRHVFYGFSFPLHLAKGRLAKTYSMYALTDETYAITSVHPDGWTKPRLLALQLTLQSYWVGGACVGAGLGTLIPDTIEGLDFALCALFITLALDAARSLATVPSLLLAAVAFSFGALLTPDSVIFTSMLSFAVLLGLRYLLTRGRWPYA